MRMEKAREVKERRVLHERVRRGAAAGSAAWRRRLSRLALSSPVSLALIHSPPEMAMLTSDRARGATVICERKARDRVSKADAG